MRANQSCGSPSADAPPTAATKSASRPCSRAPSVRVIVVYVARFANASSNICQNVILARMSPTGAEHVRPKPESSRMRVADRRHRPPPAPRNSARQPTSLRRPSPVTPASRCAPNVAHSRRGTIVAIRACAPRTRRRARVAQAANRDLAPASAPTIYRAIPFENTIDAD